MLNKFTFTDVGVLNRFVLLYGSNRFALTILLAGLLSLCGGCKEKPAEPVEAVSSSEPAEPETENMSAEELRILNLIRSEDLILDLTPTLSRYASWFQAQSTDQNPSGQGSPLHGIAKARGVLSFQLADLKSKDEGQPGFLEKFHLPLEPEFSNAPAKAENPWAEISLHGWSDIKFGVVSASFDGADQSRFTMHTKAEGKSIASEASEVKLGFKAVQDLVWTKQGSEWHLESWNQIDFVVKRLPNQPFRNVLAEIVSDENSETLKNLKRSYKDEIILKLSKTGRISLPAPRHEKWIKATSDYLFPGISVVDYDNDGDEDLFLTARWGPTQMLRNDGDGKFVEVTKDVGLYFKFLVNCALFADFDNDGDKDVVIGRPLETCVYLENNDGVFTDVTKTKSNFGKLYFVSGISVSDVNRDGLLDVYLSTYAPLLDNDMWGSKFLNYLELKKVKEHQEGRSIQLDLAGSANVLMMNRGGGELKRVDYDEDLSQWRRSFQSTWADIDNDGDDDLYVCNDFAPDAMLRNDTPKGAADPVFVSVTNEVLTNKGLGFGMGASFADFDRDGDFDLYVSNMFSKAGRRIIGHLDKVDPQVEAAASGNFLYVNQDGKFDQKAGEADDEYHINQVGWSYGGQWADFDNNGQLDLYVPSGFFTAPEELSTEVDT